jgi:release factor glutamine methyltransferase
VSDLTIEQALLWAKNHGLERLDAQLLLLHALGRAVNSRPWLLAHNTEALQAIERATYEDYVRRRGMGEPLAYITGHKEFFGLNLTVDARVLVPRPDTETLVEWALDILPKHCALTEPVQVLDLGTGSGAIALALKAIRPELQVSAMDCSEEALAVARENARRLQLDVHFQQGSWLDDVTHRYNTIACNPPYIAAHDPHLYALRYEPPQALVSGLEGLDDIRRIISQAMNHLQPDGWLLLEHGYDQAEPVRNLLKEAGFVEVQSRRDLNGIERCSGGRRQART